MLRLPQYVPDRPFRPSLLPSLPSPSTALLYSLIETAKAKGLEPYGYLRELFEKLPIARTRADYLALLPTARPAPPPP